MTNAEKAIALALIGAIIFHSVAVFWLSDKIDNAIIGHISDNGK